MIEKVTQYLKLFSQPSFLLAYRNSIVLRSIPKSGTTYLRLILSNYFYNVKKDQSSAFEAVDYPTLHSELFPNNRAYVALRRKKYVPNALLKNLGYSDFMYDHGSFTDSKYLRFLIHPKKLLFIYRNPYNLDI